LNLSAVRKFDFMLYFCSLLFDKLGMDTEKQSFTQQQRHLLKGFETQPELMKRFLSILALADEPNADGTIRSADEVEDLLIEQTRLLGKETLESWAGGVEVTLAQQAKASDRSLQMREKKR